MTFTGGPVTTTGTLTLGGTLIVANGGNGALEIRNWIIAIAAMPGKVRGELFCYEPMPPWITGIGLAELKSAA